MRGTAWALGVTGVVMSLSGLGLVLTGTAELSSPEAGLLIRVGAVLLAVSFFLWSMTAPSLITMVVVGAGLVLVLMRPGLIWAGLLAWIVGVLVNRRQSTVGTDE